MIAIVGPRKSVAWWETPAKARDDLGWEANVQLPELAELMVRSDIQNMKAETPSLTR